ncbi:SET domain-containing protein [Aquabacterium sp.]|uniref:SET domain-containing protein n=1 Tax=Aquabacterium sp. TaxID=1872578 RepID=UPI0035B1518A
MPTLRTLAPAVSSDPAPAPQAEPEVTVRPKGQPANPQKYAVEVRPSQIDGLGAFAAEPIPARRKIGEITGEAVSTAEAFRRTREAARTGGRIFMVAVSEGRAIDASLSSDPMRYANHACVPNMVMKVQQGRVAFYALRDIEAGEELTASYGATHHAGRLRCRCGAPGCKGRL